MAIAIKKNTKVAVKLESPAGTYTPPSAGTDYIMITDAFEMTPARETIARDNILGLGLSVVAPRQGMASVTGTIPVEMKANSIAGGAPEYDVLLKSLMGGKRSSVSVVTKAAVNTETVVAIEDADIAKFNIGDIVKIKHAGKHHLSPIVAVTPTDGESDSTITLLVPHSEIIPSGVTIEAFTTYYLTNDAQRAPYSVTKYVENASSERAISCVTSSLSLENFTTYGVANFNLGFEGADSDRVLQAPQGGAPIYQTSLPPIVIKACAYKNGQEIYINNFSLSIENTISWLMDTCRGKTQASVTARNVSGSIDPFKEADASTVAWFDEFNDGTPFSLFIEAFNPTAVEGENKEAICFYLPKCVITELGESDLDGNLQEAISFSAVNPDDAELGEAFIGFI